MDICPVEDIKKLITSGGLFFYSNLSPDKIKYVENHLTDCVNCKNAVNFVQFFKKQVNINYTNYRGIRSSRVVVPTQVWFGSTVYHDDEQWLLDAYDVGKKQDRTFAINDVHSWSLLDKDG